MEVEVNGVVYESQQETRLCEGCLAIGNRALCDTLYDEDECRGIIWIKKEVNQPIKPEEKETTVQKKEIDKSKKYKTVKGVDVELVHENYRAGCEYLWVGSPSDGEKFVFSTNKYGEHHLSQLYNLVEFNPLEELSKMPVDTLVKAISKSTGKYTLRYMSHVSPDNEGVYLFKDGRTSRTQEGTCLYDSEYYSFEIVE